MSHYKCAYVDMASGDSCNLSRVGVSRFCVVHCEDSEIDLSGHAARMQRAAKYELSSRQLKAAQLLGELVDDISGDVPAPVRLKAATEILDRAGGTPKQLSQTMDATLEVTQGGDMRETFQKMFGRVVASVLAPTPTPPAIAASAVAVVESGTEPGPLFPAETVALAEAAAADLDEPGDAA